MKATKAILFAAITAITLTACGCGNNNHEQEKQTIEYAG